MRISTRGRYATRALTDLAMHYKQEPVLLRDISARQAISLPYLEQIVTPLKAARLIRSTRGPGGGISLAKSPKSIKVLEIIQALEGPIAPVGCVDNPQECTRIQSCAAHDIWTDVARAVHGVLASVTLQDMVERQKGKIAGKASATIKRTRSSLK